ncbi:transposase family protein [Streptomyces sp. NBC_00289]|uniref:transposase family protein n=1 Tax=Streptomyces sp. NBC_00289 TaxID=2975703 RepID=UPI00352E3AB2
MHLVTADEAARACPECGVFSSRMKGPATTRPRDLPYGERGLEFFWHKRRWWCGEVSCPRKSFTEQVPQIPAGARITTRCWASTRPGAAAPAGNRIPTPGVAAGAGPPAHRVHRRAWHRCPARPGRGPHRR